MSSKEQFDQKVQQFKLQHEFIIAIEDKDVATVKYLLSKPELDLNYIFSYRGCDTEVHIVELKL